MSFTMAQVAARIGCSELTVYRHIQRGWLKADKEPGRFGAVRVRAEWLDEYLAEQVVIGTRTLSAAEAARLLHVHVRTVERLVATGELRAHPAAGRALRICRDSVEACAAERRNRVGWLDRRRLAHHA
jgi:excisionase family DNA binding protein